MRNQRRLFAWLLCLGLLLMLAVSSAYIVLEAGHACCGGMCETCECIVKTKALLRGFVLFALVLSLLLGALCIPEGHSAHAGTRLPVFGTLVRWKIRLND